MKLDLSILREPPEYTASALISLEALAPLSMVTKMPGTYYRSETDPSDGMLLAMLENALGWHISGRERNPLLKTLSKRHKQAAHRSGVDYGSLLQWHVRIASRHIPEVMHYEDLWARHIRGGRFPSGSRNYDSTMIPLMNAMRRGAVAADDSSNARREPELLRNFQGGDKIHIDVLRPYFAQYFASPTPREYVLPHGVYRYKIETSTALVDLIGQALENPAAPLYLGSNDGWVDTSWEVL